MQVNHNKINKQVEVLEIFPTLLDEYWNLVDFMLREGLKFDGNPMSIKHLKEFIKKGEMQLFSLAIFSIVSAKTSCQSSLFSPFNKITSH